MPDYPKMPTEALLAEAERLDLPEWSVGLCGVDPPTYRITARLVEDKPAPADGNVVSCAHHCEIDIATYLPLELASQVVDAHNASRKLIPALVQRVRELSADKERLEALEQAAIDDPILLHACDGGSEEWPARPRGLNVGPTYGGIRAAVDRCGDTARKAAPEGEGQR